MILRCMMYFEVKMRFLLFAFVVTAVILQPAHSASWRTNAARKPSNPLTHAVEIETTTPIAPSASSSQRLARYARFDPPVVTPTNDSQIVRESQYVLHCRGKGRPVTWILPRDSGEVLATRSTLKHSEEAEIFSAELILSNLMFSDTGTYTCTYNGTEDIDSIDNSTSVHLYVDNGINLLRITGIYFEKAIQSASYTIPCMPTHPDVSVTLWMDTDECPQVLPDKYITYDPKEGFRISPVMMKRHAGDYVCKAEFRGRKEEYWLSLQVKPQTSFVPKPFINQTMAKHVKRGDSFSLVCSVTVDHNAMVELKWKLPNTNAYNESRISTPPKTATKLDIGIESNYVKYEQILNIRSSTVDDQGTYTCVVEDHSHNKNAKSDFIRILEKEEPYIRIYYDGYQSLEANLDHETKPIQWVVQIDAHPQPGVEWYDPQGIRIDPSISSDYEILTSYSKPTKTMLRIQKLSLSKAGNYMVKVYTENITKTENFTLQIRSKPEIRLWVENQESFYKVGTEYKIKCSSEGFPPPEINWMFKPCSAYDECDNSQMKSLTGIEYKKLSQYGRESTLVTNAEASGRFICQASNSIKTEYAYVPFFVTDVPKDGFDITGPKKILAGDPLRIRCSASVYNYSQDSMEWFKDSLHGYTPLKAGHGQLFNITSFSSKISFGQELSVDNAQMADRGRYVCKVAEKITAYTNFQPEPPKYYRQNYDFVNGERVDHKGMNKPPQHERIYEPIILPLRQPTLVETNLNGDEILIVDEPSKGLKLKCFSDGLPKPKVKWWVHGAPLSIPSNTTRVQLLDQGQVLQINYVTQWDEGMYECVSENKAGNAKAKTMVQLQASAQNDSLYSNISVPVLVIVAICICLVGILIAFAKCLYRNKSKSKEHHLPKSPRLTQYELPRNISEEDECRMTLTSSITRDGSISPNDNIHYGSHLMAFGSPCQDPCMCHSQIHQPCHLGPSVLLPQCSLCDYSMQTLPLHRMGTLQSKKNFDPYKARSQSPRLSAEF